MKNTWKNWTQQHELKTHIGKGLYKRERERNVAMMRKVMERALRGKHEVKVEHK